MTGQLSEVYHHSNILKVFFSGAVLDETDLIETKVQERLGGVDRVRCGVRQP